MNEARPWPLDLESMKKGDVVPVEVLEPLLGVPFESREYQLRLAEFSWDLERKLWSMGRQFTVTCERGTLVIHEDSSASVVAQRGFLFGYRKAFRNHRRILAVDATRLDEPERRRHERAIVVQGAILAGMMTGARAVGHTPYRRNTPAFLPP